MSHYLTLIHRPGEQFVIYKEPPEGVGELGLFAVALVETPAPPGDAHSETRWLAVIGMGNYPSEDTDPEIKWGWIGFDGYTKEIIGETLIEAGAEVGRWYYMLIDRVPEYAAPPESDSE